MILICPACGNNLSEMMVADIKVDVCKGGCGGVWLDNFELEKFDEAHEHAGAVLLNVEKDPNARVDHKVKRHCPRCSDVKMRRRYFTIKRNVTIDECASCGGVWLDAGELSEIRNTFKTKKERDKAFDEYFEDVFGETMRMAKGETEEKLRKTRKAVRAFRFICPTYYIPGKQKWGAF